MKKNFAAFLYFFIIFSELYLGNLNLLFGYSPRLISILLFFIIIITQKIKIKSMWLIKSMIIYLIFHCISIVFDDYADFSLFAYNFLISRYLITTAIVCITSVCIPKYISFKTFINILLLVTSINTFILFGQFFEYSSISFITEFFVGDRFSEIDMERDLFKHSTIHGLTGTVYSGYLITVLVPLILYKLEKSKYWYLFWVSLLIFTSFTAFILQQRSAFFLIFFNIITYFVFYSLKKKKQKLGFITLIIFIFFSTQIKNIAFTSDLSKSFVFELETRVLLFFGSIDFISNYPLFGGVEFFKKLYGGSPHNLFFNAWIRAGVLGFLSILFVFIKMTKISIKSIKDSLGKNILMYTFCTILINLFIMSFTHNSGLVTGEVFTFIFIILILKVKKINLENIQ